MNRPGSMWGPGDSTGSIGVVTINMNRLGYEAKDKEDFLEKLEHYMTLAKESLEIKRKVVEKNLKNGLMPFTKRYLGTFNNHFSTIGLCGMHECSLNFLGKGIETEEGKAFTIDVMNHMREKIRGFQNDTGSLYNLEATPAESTSYRFARLDKKMYPNIITSGDDEPFLTNSTQLPVGHTDDAIAAIEHQNEIQPLYTGGTMFHTFLGERMANGEACKRLVKKIAHNTRMPYFSITPTFSVCKTHGYIKGEHFECPECGAETEVYSRIVGYFRPVKNWNKGKKEEYKFRKEFKEDVSLKSQFKSKIQQAIEKPIEVRT
jgi:ribonucleoside-triphosphate reductase